MSAREKRREAFMRTRRIARPLVVDGGEYARWASRDAREFWQSMQFTAPANASLYASEREYWRIRRDQLQTIAEVNARYRIAYAHETRHAASAWSDAQDVVRADAAGLVAHWAIDEWPDNECNDTPDNASAINRCEYEHDGKHVISRDRSEPRRGHAHGKLESRCDFSVDAIDGANREFLSCAVVLPCDEHESADDCDYDPWRCDDCRILADLHGIDVRNDDGTEREKRSIERELIGEALAVIDDEQAKEAADERAWYSIAAL